MGIKEALKRETEKLYRAEVAKFAQFLHRRFDIDAASVTSLVYKCDGYIVSNYYKHDDMMESCCVDILCSSCNEKRQFVGLFEWNGDKLVCPLVEKLRDEYTCDTCNISSLPKPKTWKERLLTFLGSE